jgi:hypothetical protein
MVSVDALRQHGEKLVEKRTEISAELAAALKKPEIYEIIVGRPNTAKAIKERISIVHQLMRKMA